MTVAAVAAPAGKGFDVEEAGVLPLAYGAMSSGMLPVTGVFLSVGGLLQQI